MLLCVTEMTVAANIRRVRQERAWTQAKLGEAAGFRATGIVAAYENYRRVPTLKGLERIAQVLEVAPHYLVTPYDRPPCPLCTGVSNPGWTCGACGVYQPAAGRP
jgi:DNA-binding XRE family transcriptional regulator